MSVRQTPSPLMYLPMALGIASQTRDVKARAVPEIMFQHFATDRFLSHGWMMRPGSRSSECQDEHGSSGWSSPAEELQMAPKIRGSLNPRRCKCTRKDWCAMSIVASITSKISNPITDGAVGECNTENVILHFRWSRSISSKLERIVLFMQSRFLKATLTQRLQQLRDNHLQRPTDLLHCQ